MQKIHRAIAACFVALCLFSACSQTPPPPALVTVPNVAGELVPQAEAALQAAGLRSESRVEGPCPGCPIVNAPPTPTVLIQTPAAGSHVAKGTVVVLTHRCVC
jgi:hypothetical protein